MLGESADKLFTIELHHLFYTPVGVIFGDECHFAILDGKDVLIVDCHPMGVLSQISHYMIGISQRWLTMHNPWREICLLNNLIKEHQLIVFSQCPFQAVE